MALTDGKGADVCFDPVGGELFDAALSSLGWGGRILLIGFVAGVPQIPANRLLVKHRAALGSSLRYFRWHAPDKLRRSVEELSQWYGEGKLRPLRHAPPAARAERGGHPPPHGSQGARQGRGGDGAALMEIRVRAARAARRGGDHRQPAAPQRHDAPDDGGARARVGRAGAERLPLHRADRARATAPSAPGADISGDLSAARRRRRIVSHALLKTDAYSKPIVAAVNGDCVGGGLELLLATDIRAAAPHARFGLPEVRWSIYPFGGATVKLIQQIGYVHAMDLLLTGRLIDAAEAARLGLVNRVVPAADLMAWALETAETIAANSPTAVQAVKRQISATIADHARTREALDQELGDRVRASAHFTEGVAAFREKRPPRYE